MEAIPLVRSSLLGILLLVMKLSMLLDSWVPFLSQHGSAPLAPRILPMVDYTASPRGLPPIPSLRAPDDSVDKGHIGSKLLVQNWVHLYNFLLLKVMLFNHWLSRLVLEAQGSCGQHAHSPPVLKACPMGLVLQAGLALIEVPVWLVLSIPRLIWVGMLGCAQALGLALKLLDVWEWLGLSVAFWKNLLLSCLHSLMLAPLLLLLLTWRLCWKAQCCSLCWLPSKALLENCVVLEFLALLKRLYWWAESTMVFTSWHLAYLVTWTTCLAFHLLQAAFEHTAQLAQARETEPQEASEPLSEFPLLESSASESGPVLPEHGTLGE